jgi:hypothetical protein
MPPGKIVLSLGMSRGIVKDRGMVAGASGQNRVPPFADHIASISLSIPGLRRFAGLAGYLDCDDGTSSVPEKVSVFCLTEKIFLDMSRTIGSVGLVGHHGRTCVAGGDRERRFANR